MKLVRCNSLAEFAVKAARMKRQDDAERVRNGTARVFPTITAESMVQYPDGSTVQLTRGKELLVWTKGDRQWTNKPISMKKAPKEAVALLRNHFFAFEYEGKWEGSHATPEYVGNAPVYSVAAGQRKALLQESPVLGRIDAVLARLDPSGR